MIVTGSVCRANRNSLTIEKSRDLISREINSVEMILVMISTLKE